MRLRPLTVLASLATASLLTVVPLLWTAAAQPPTDPTAPPDPNAIDVEREREYSAADRARRARVVAKVGAAAITVGDIEDQINPQSPFLRDRYRDPAKLREYVDNMVRLELLAAEAERRGYGDHPLVARSTKQNSVQQLIRRVFDERIRPASVPDEDVVAYYEANLEDFRRDEMVRASHLLVASRERAIELIGELTDADTREFRQAAREHSIDTETKLRGGDLRYFNRQGRSPSPNDRPVESALATAAFELGDVGDMTREPVAVGDSWSIVKLTARRPTEERSVEDAEAGIRLRLWRERRQQEINEFVSTLRQQHQPEVNEELIAPIQLEVITPEDRRGFAAHGHGADVEPSASPAPEPTAAE
jgi:peptidyl-prolyl cis-trans isomerase C